MGVPVIDPEDPAGYDCNCANNKNSVAPSCNCTCSCDSNGSSSSSSSSSSNSCRSNNSCSCSCSASSKGSSNPGTAALTLTFANKDSCGAANSYHYSKTETLPTTTPNALPITRLTKDLVGNSKEFRIEHNTSDLRIIGNSNRIRIGSNQGNLQIIGNSTRLKITNNTGGIRYTGNEGRICLGSDSAQQVVDYVGNNGKLKVVKASEMLSEKPKIHKQKTPKETVTPAATTASTEKNCVTSAKAAATGTAATANSELPSHSTPKKVKVKSASFGGDYSSQWRQFNELFQKQSWRDFDSASMPNLRNENAAQKEAGDDRKAEQNSKNSRSSKINAKCCKINNNINVVGNYGNICIKNAVNVTV